MHKLTATERLRELLDERGVEWKEHKHQLAGSMALQLETLWGQPVDNTSGKQMQHVYHYRATEMGDGRLFLEAQLTTPEQAIAATLGSGTCHPIISDNLTESEGTGDAWADCSECGHLLYVLTDPNSEPPNYCPNCGAKVIG